MRRLASACFALLTLGPVPAMAADMPVKAPPAAPPPPVATWTGCYVGGNVGGGWAREKYTDPLALPFPAPLANHTAEGVVGGGQVGCDFQFGNWVIGAQGMFDGADLNGNHLFGEIFKTHIPWFATATARVGYAFSPEFLLYVKGGGAWKRDEERIIDPVFLVVEGAADVTRTGGTVGGGFEWQFWKNVSFFAEYDYLAFGTKRVIFAAFPEPGEVGPLPPFPLDIQQNVSVVVAGFNWRFGPWH